MNEEATSLKETRFCPRCKKSVVGHRFCPYCGSTLRSKVVVNK